MLGCSSLCAGVLLLCRGALGRAGPEASLGVTAGDSWLWGIPCEGMRACRAFLPLGATEDACGREAGAGEGRTLLASPAAAGPCAGVETELSPSCLSLSPLLCLPAGDGVLGGGDASK